VYPAEAYPGVASFIDLLIVWDPSAPITGARVHGAVVRRPPPPARSGNHRPGGWLVAAGPGIVPSPDSTRCAIVDLGPSVAARLGVTLPDTDGRVVAHVAGIGTDATATASRRRPAGVRRS
jgi:hypothetical protein